jgi:hypothetical protein
VRTCLPAVALLNGGRDRPSVQEFLKIFNIFDRPVVFMCVVCKIDVCWAVVGPLLILTQCITVQ